MARKPYSTSLVVVLVTILLAGCGSMEVATGEPGSGGGRDGGGAPDAGPGPVTEPGTISELFHLGTDPPTISGAKYDVAVFFLKFWSLADGGLNIAAKLYVPVGTPPEDGWPAKVWLHGFGGPGAGYKRWPFKGNDWRGRGYKDAMAFASYGFVNLTPWVPGAGPSEPFATYSPLSVERNAQAGFDAYAALAKLPEYFKSHPELSALTGVTVAIDPNRQVMSTHCISTPTMPYWASKLHEHPEAAGVKAIISTNFVVSLAYITACDQTAALNLTDTFRAAGLRALWAGVMYTLAKERGWPLELFFKPGAIEVFEEPVQTPAGTLPRMRAARLEPIPDSDVAQPLLDAITADLGHEPTSEEITAWIFTDEVIDMSLNDLQGIVNHPFYQKYFTASDPFFEQNITPFNPGIPLLVIGNGVDESVDPVMPGPYKRFLCQGMPKIDTFTSPEWGWTVELFFEYGVNPEYQSGGPGYKWTMKKLQKLLYPAGVPAELE